VTSHPLLSPRQMPVPFTPLSNSKNATTQPPRLNRTTTWTDFG